MPFVTSFKSGRFFGRFLGLSACLVTIEASCASDPKPVPALAETVHQATAALSVPPLASLAPGALLRQLSFDLRGRPPALDELDRAVGGGQAGPDVIDRYLKSSEFLGQVESWHAEVLWPNIARYQPTAVKVFAVPPASKTASPYGVGFYWVGGSDISPDPALVVDAEKRMTHVVAITSEAFRAALRGNFHAYPSGLCDLRPEAEYPDPSVVGTPANRYTVPAERTGNGVPLTALYYSEEPETRGLVMPIRDVNHCPNFCRKSSCTFSNWQNEGPTEGCFTDMATPGDDVAGRHELDTPGMRCADGYVREINPCHFNKTGKLETNTAFTIDHLPIPFRNPQRPQRHSKPNKTVFNYQTEGWRWAEHYWSKGTKVKTCALEAQDREFGIVQKLPNGQPMPCAKALSGTNYFIQDPSCGCGPKGAYCQPSVERTDGDSRAELRLRDAIEQEPLRIVRSVVERDEDYLTILNTRRSFVNGPLAFAWRYQTEVLRGEGFRGISAPADKSDTWDKTPYEEDAWAEYLRPERHSGILTSLGFLLRFPTYRARVAQYRRVFLCSKEFDYAPEPDPNDSNPDIAARAGCASCHARLENDGIWFGRYPDRSPRYLDPAVVPTTDKVFQIPFKFRDPALLARLDKGPSDMVAQDLIPGGAASVCAVRTAWNRLVRRDPSDEELKGIVAKFEAEGRRYRSLVRAIVSHEAYMTVVP